MALEGILYASPLNQCVLMGGNNQLAIFGNSIKSLSFGNEQEFEK
jgi:hypothetical protein